MNNMYPVTYYDIIGLLIEFERKVRTVCRM